MNTIEKILEEFDKKFPDKVETKKSEYIPNDLKGIVKSGIKISTIKYPIYDRKKIHIFLKTSLQTLQKETRKEVIEEMLKEIVDIDCACDAGDCERCNYLRNLN